MKHGEPLDSFLRDLSRASAVREATTSLPSADEIDAAIRQVESSADLATRFIAAARSAGASAVRVRLETVQELICDLARDAGLKSVLIAIPVDWPAEIGSRLESQFVAAGIRVCHERDELTLFSVDATLTGVVAAIAESGSLMVAAGAGVSRGESLYAPNHIALVPVGQIVADLADASLLLADHLERCSNVTLITGPSKTADIEGVLVTGVHGPGVLHIIVIDD